MNTLFIIQFFFAGKDCPNGVVGSYTNCVQWQRDITALYMTFYDFIIKRKMANIWVCLWFWCSFALFSFVYDFCVLILDEAVLALGRLYLETFVVNDDVDWNKANRHQAYRQFIMRTHGRLGAGDRRVLCGGLGTSTQTLLAKHRICGNLIKISPFISLSVCFCRSWKDLTQPRLRHALVTSCRDLFNK